MLIRLFFLNRSLVTMAAQINLPQINKNIPAVIIYFIHDSLIFNTINGYS